MTRSIVVFLGAVLAFAPAARAEQKKLAFLIPGLFGERGLIVGSEAPLPNGQTHSAHFNNAFQSEFTQFNVALASQLATLPVPAPAAAFTYKFDETLGVFSRSTDSFGPILSERAETAGKGKFNFGFAYQHFTFDSLEDASLESIPAVFTHDLPAPGGRSDVVSTVNSIDTSVDQYVAFANFGLLSRLDVSVAIPIVTTEIRASSVATVERIGTVDPKIHFLGEGQGDYSTSRTFTESGSASGIGDILVRFKGKAFEWGSNGLAFALETRLPTGDEEDFLGSGAFGLKPAIIFSSSHKVVSFHLNGAYQWNGDSLLAGNVQAGTKADMPDQILYSGGLAVAASKKLTLVADFLGRHFIDTPRLQTKTFTALDGRTTLPDISFQNDSFDQLFVATGLRLNITGGLLLDANVLVSLTETGLRDKVTPLLSLAYSF